MVASTRKKAKKSEMPTQVEPESPSRTRSGRSRQGSEALASGVTSKSTTPKSSEERTSSPSTRQTRSSSKKKQTNKDDVMVDVESAQESKIGTTDKVEAMQVDHSPPSSKSTSKDEHSNDGPTTASKGSNKKKKDKPKKKKSSAKKKRKSAKPIAAHAVAPSKPPPTMDVSVHRVRYLNYRPRPILCLATTPFDPKAADYVALSRENGSVELASPDEKWRTVATVAGTSTRTVDVMAWTCGTCSNTEQEQQHQSASFSQEGSFSSTFHETHHHVQSRRTCLGASRDGTVFVVDFAHGCQTAVTGSGGGGVFSLTSLCGKECCSDGSNCPQLVAAGCQDGSIRIYKVVNKSANPKLVLVSTVPCASTAILSLAWRRVEKDSQGMGGTALFAGVADGTIRRLDCVSALTTARLTGTSAHAISTGSVVSNENQNWKSTLRMTVESYGRTTPTRVWALEALADGTLVSGDSLGHVQFWDGNTGTLLQSFDQNDSKADVLSLVVSANECRVFASGVDSRVICIERPETSPSSNTGPQKWIMTHAQRPHTHDVKAMAVCKQRDPTGCFSEGTVNELLCTGGVDTKLCSYAIKNFGRFRPKSLYPWPCISPISVANDARILAMRREDRVDLYKLAPPTTVTMSPVLVKEDETLIGTIGIKAKHNFICSDITSDGRFLVVSNSTGLTLFRLDFAAGTSGRTSLEPSRVEIDRSLRIPSLAVKFVSNSRLACAGFDGRIHVLKIGDEDVPSLTLQHSFPASHANFAIQSLRASPDGAWLAAERSGTARGTVRIYSIAEGDCKHWWDLPALESPVTSARFLEADKPSLVVSCANCAVYVFDVEQRSLSDWSEKQGIPMRSSLPKELSHRSDFPVRVASNPSTPNMFLLGFFGAFTAIDMNNPMPKHCRVFPETHVRGKKRKRHSHGSSKDAVAASGCNGNCTICLRYNSMLYMDFIAKNEMLVVEQPWLNVVASFPEALERKVYGT